MNEIPSCFNPDAIDSNPKPIPKTKHVILTKDQLIQDAIIHGLVSSETFEGAKAEFRCHKCPDEPTCKFAWDLYNIGDDWCLAEK